MNKVEFLQELKGKIGELPYSEVEKTLAFYAEAIDDRIEDGKSESEAVASLDCIENIVCELQLSLPLSTLIGKKIENSRQKAKSNTVWIILAICGSPVWLPILASLIVVIISVYVSIWAVIISLFATVVSLGISGIAGLVTVIFGLTINGPLQEAMLFGMSLMFCGLFAVLIPPMWWLAKKMISGTGLFLRWVKRLFITREVPR